MSECVEFSVGSDVEEAARCVIRPGCKRITVREETGYCFQYSKGGANY